MNTSQQSFWHRIKPAIILMLLAVLIAETLPGATRPSVYLGFPLIFVFELTVWGGFAVLTRFLVRRKQLAWSSLLLLGIAVGIAEEFLIQQTSIAPLVIKLKGVEYARAFGINYLYLVWALAYESVFVVLIPVALAELLFATRRENTWLNKVGIWVLCAWFCVGALGAWFSWTQIARIKVFHMEPYHPPVHLLLLGILLIAGLMTLALRFVNKINNEQSKLAPPTPWLMTVLGAIFSLLLWALVVIAFGATPALAPIIPLVSALLILTLSLFLMSRWSSHETWCDRHRYYLIAGAITGNMGGGFVGYIDSTTTNVDFWGKVIVDVIAVVLLVVLGISLKTSKSST